MLHEPLGDHPRHYLAGVADLLSAAAAQRVGDIFGRGGFPVRLVHALDDSSG
jgi:hypothetical protein